VVIALLDKQAALTAQQPLRRTFGVAAEVERLKVRKKVDAAEINMICQA